MNFFKKVTNTLGLSDSELANIAGAYATGGFTDALGVGLSSLGNGGMDNIRTTFPTGGYQGPMNGTEQGQSVAVSQATQTRPQETSLSGEFYRAPMQAGFGLMGPATQIVRRFLPEAVGGAVIGGGLAAAPVLVDALTGRPKKLRVTRKLKRLVREAVDNFGVEGAMQMSGLDRDTIMYIYTKKMRNDGPYVTKAAVRKTRQTVRKMKYLCDMYDDLRPAAKRRAPARRAMAGTRITTVK